ncbi:A disintegrin and metalloproteinase with thrombospondin motifs 9-like [Crassostrea virginica]
MTIWSGNSSDLMRCGVECAKEQYCVSLLYDKTTGSCKLFSVVFDSDESGNIDYWILNQESTRWESCQELASCSGITTDGEYWIYPTAINGRRTKIYCHNLASTPLHYVTLKYPNRFIQHDKLNLINGLECLSDFKGPLNSLDFSKVRIQIENMEVIGSDYTFASLNGSPYIQYGQALDCNGQALRHPCPHFGNATINVRETGLALDPTMVFGLVMGYSAEIRDFIRSDDGTKISFSCAGWCAKCGPTTGPIRFQRSKEFSMFLVFVKSFLFRC